MAQPQQQYQPPPYRSPHATPSPLPGAAHLHNYGPPVKRQRLSPGSPPPNQQLYQSPPITNGNLPYQAQINPYLTQHVNPYPPPALLMNGSTMRTESFPASSGPSTPQAQQQYQPPAGTMGPPSKPEQDRHMDLNDIADVMTGSGVDLKAEEAALHFGAGPARSVYTGMGQPAYFDSQTRIMANNVPGSRDSFYGGGTLNQHATAFSPVSLQAESEARARVAKRAQAERKQHHLNEPFLLPGVMVRKINKAGDTTQVRPPMEGVFMPTPGNITRLLVQGPEGQEKLALLTHEPILALQSGMGDILTLLSFAARDRIRSVLEDSASIAYQRKMTGSGVVPPDFLDIVKGVGAAKETTALPAPLIGEQGPGAQSRKRSYSQANDLPTPVSETDQQLAMPVATIAYPNLLAIAVQAQADAEEEFEKARLAKRAKRTTASLINSSDPASRSGSVPGSSAPGASAVEGMAPDQRITKKEAKRRDEAAAASRQANATSDAVSLALGGGAKKYSWMMGGKPGGGGGLGTSFGRKPPLAAAKAKERGTVMPTSSGASAIGGTTTANARKALGDFREDTEDGKGVQVRDVLAILEDGKERRTLAKAYGRLNRR